MMSGCEALMRSVARMARQLFISEITTWVITSVPKRVALLSVGTRKSIFKTSLKHGTSLLKQPDLSQMSSDLEKLASALDGLAKDPEHYAEIGQVRGAAAAAKSGNGAKVLEFLSRLTNWTVDTATKIGITVVAELIKRQMSS